ncbi:probable phospholipid-transporting ATPase IM isoform X2 [Bolinopsis microptera]|uniref:probable phospholipid-transporting ATPase IM isoform X2 n=1 Tax=Bolinopsis microptera TaxID=2820187 RepID=UPI003078EE12
MSSANGANQHQDNEYETVNAMTTLERWWDQIKIKLGIKKGEIDQGLRVLRSNDPAYNQEQNFPDNFISTTKYKAYSFLIVNLCEQFSRLANAYFLLILILQLIPWIAALDWWITLLPLLFVLSVTGFKDAYDDIQRWRSDKSINNRTTTALINKQWSETKWSEVNVGTLLRIKSNESIPADLLLISSSSPNGLAYIETAELDGETNLKVRQSLAETESYVDDTEKLSKFFGRVECELPNNRLDKYIGLLAMESIYDGDGDLAQYSLDNDKILLRGMVLKNTSWVVGLTVFTGHQTKLMMNSGKPTLKRTNVDQLLNKIVYYILGLLLALCTVCGVGSFIWETIRGEYFSEQFAPWISPFDNALLIAVMRIPSYIIVLNTLVPISLYVSVEMIRLGQSMFINWDLLMYHNETDTPAKARSTALNEELGQIKYVFSDKTGTLTQNVMVFLKASINSVQYGSGTGSEEDIAMDPAKSVDFSWNEYADPKFTYDDESIVTAVNDRDPEVDKFLKVLSLCHTVMSSEEDGKLVYQAQSPDEEALLTAARNFGYVFLTRTQKTVTMSLLGVTEEYEMLALLDFDNVRKRMSIILRCPDGKIRLFCKGADTTVIPLLNNNDPAKLEATLDHMNFYAREGLRTLIIACKEISDQDFAEWEIIFEKAQLSLEDRDDQINAAQDLIETELDLVGSSAIEDKLQDGVPETIANLARASIKIWVLTGDKQETAINIGYSCKLIKPRMEVLILEGDESDEVKFEIKELQYRIDELKRVAKKEGVDAEFALVVTGSTLRYALEESLKYTFLDLALQCAAVICCRVTPLQKALVVRLVKNFKPNKSDDDNITLAIGDGANDVSMIREAHIGVGISGKEGMQAVLASDFCFAQFRFLERLILVHGHWSYIRMCKFLRYFFFKNFAFTLVQLFYAPFCGFTAQTIFDPLYITLYNVVFTSMPVMLVGIMDQELSVENAPPEVYEVGQLNQLFNKQAFALSGFHGFVVAAGCLFIPYQMFAQSINIDGLDQQSMYFIGTAIAGIVTIVVNFQVALETTLWTVYNHILTWGSIISWFLLFLVICSPFAFHISPDQFSYFDGIYRVVQTRIWWLTMCLTLVICLFPFIGYRLYVILTQPTLLQEVVYNIEKEKVSKLTTLTKTLKAPLKEIADSIPLHLHQGHKGGHALYATKRQQSRKDLFGKPSSAQASTRGYAFASGEGYGRRMIAGGEAMVQIKRQDTRHLPSQIVDVEGEDIQLPMPVNVRPRSGSMRSSTKRAQASRVVTVD